MKTRGPCASALILLVTSLVWGAEGTDSLRGVATPVQPPDPQRAAALRRQAQEQRIQGERQAEIASLRAALKALPGDGNAEFGLAVALAEEGGGAEARGRFESLVGREPYRIVALEHVAALDRAAGRMTDELARRRALSDDGRRDLADLAALNAALKRAGRLESELQREGGAPDAAAPDRAWERLRRALLLQALGREGDARIEAIQALLLDPADETIRRGVLRLAGFPPFPPVWESALRERIGAAPDAAASQDERGDLALAFVLAIRGKRDEARAHLESARARFVDRTSVHLALGDFLAASPGAGDAAEEFRRAIAIEPARVAAHVALAKALASRGSWTEAERAALDAIALDPERGSAYVLLGEARLATGLREEALTAFRSALFLDPHDPSGRGRIGLYRCLASLGRAAEGPAFLTWLLPKEPDATARERAAFMGGRCADETCAASLRDRDVLRAILASGKNDLEPPGGPFGEVEGFRILSDASAIRLTKQTRNEVPR